MARVLDAVATPLGAVVVGRGAVTALVAVVGLLVGSFLNVVVYRVPRGLSVVEPRSFCPHCDTPVRSVDNIPVVSWVLLGGRCRQCRGRISVRYPLVELTTGIVFAAIGWGLGPHWAVPGFCVIAATLIALVAVERDGLPAPSSVAVIGTAVAGALLLAAGVVDRRWAHLVGLIVGVVVSAAVVAGGHRTHVRPDDASSPMAALPVLLPAGAALGWLGPAYAAEGLATTVAVLLVARGARSVRGSGSTRSDRGVLGSALTAGVLVATVTAVAWGAGPGM